ncbi:NAD(P)/FAD-dependent oxidoreductase [Lacrimispora saccharolytica]|uniref:HI0933 family protein n=1 Tax=Lacrimispora saccharolytica (strain ATCC 35040 / DSM 2544 / NRCC 2533 / WM1) TaxID=610130 RepID=D9R6S0_LACSW|nr:NAD(P)/FAD-dependent oxidoreductase [Lacrimispora saccharolytica]ADL03576.1 HI0933 family protein [[Clostridium] saccharolyticum WM1]QRV18278.1 NAD(P)/FAD-dependent oxidoreductase [Lacrimispora saccharolytica]
MNTVLIVGGGAAGMLAGIAAAMKGSTVHIFEKNEKLGKKVYITGKGRCNVTNACDTEELFGHVVTNAKFLYSSFYGFTNFDMMHLLEELGCPLKIERGNRVFPASDKSSDVIKALTKRLLELGVSIHYRTQVERLLVEDGILRGLVLKDGGKKTKVYGDSVIVACGGLSYQATGSTGDGYEMAKEAGHSVTSLSPALVPFLVEEPVVKELQGLSLRNVEAVVLKGKKVIYKEFGEMLFTHYGVSGPVLLSASSYAVKELKKGPLTLSIDLKPALSEEQLDSRILRDFEEAVNKQFKNSLDHLYPSKLVPVMVDASGISPEKRVNEITREERQRLVRVTKDFRLTLTGLRGYHEAIITQGGISVKEVNPSTLESKLLPSLYFAGEVLDLDGVTGGFNLQIAWSTGWAAGSAAGEENSKDEKSL